MLSLTNKNLRAKSKREITKGELLKFFGLMILITRTAVRDRRKLWDEQGEWEYLPVHAFNKTGMKSWRFEEIWRWLRWSDCPEDPDGTHASSAHRWKQVDDFVANFNKYRANNFNPSDLLCVDESMSKWYGLGGHWINMGLPMYIAIDRKPVQGCEIQNLACSRSHVMLRLKLVKSREDEEEFEITQEDASGVLHGTNVMMELLDP